MTYHAKILKIGLVLSLWMMASSYVGAQSVNQLLSQLNNAQSDSAKVSFSNRLAKAYQREGSDSLGVVYAEKALRLSRDYFMPDQEINSLVILGEIYEAQKAFTESVDYYFQAQAIAKRLDKKQQLITIYESLGRVYQAVRFDVKALEYYKLTYEHIPKPIDADKKEYLLQNIGLCYLNLSSLDSARYYYEALLNHQRDHSGKPSAVVLRQLIEVYKSKQRYEDALSLYNELVAIQLESNDQSGLINSYNAVGYIFQKLSDPNKALEYFQKAINANKESDKSGVDIVPMLINIGVIQLSLFRYDQALESFTEVVEIQKERKYDLGVADALNYVASVYMSIDDTRSAIKNLEEAIVYASKTESGLSVLARSYQKLFTIYERNGNYRKALENYQQYITMRDSANSKRQNIQNKYLEKQKEAEQAEKELQQIMLDRQAERLELTQLRNITERQEREFERLQKEQALKEAQLEAEKLAAEQSKQDLLIAKQRLEAKKRDQAIVLLEKSRELQDSKLKQQELENREKQNKIQLLNEQSKAIENKQKAAELELEKSRLQFFYTISVLGLFVLVLILMVYAYIKNRSKNKQLERQRDEIQTQKAAVEKSYQNIQVLSEFGQKLTATLSLADLDALVFAYLSNLMKISSFGIGIYNEQQKFIRYINSVENEAAPTKLVHYLDDATSFTVWCFRNEKEIFINDLESQRGKIPINVNFSSKIEPQSLIFLPLLFEEEPIGVLRVYAEQKNAFSKNDISVIKTLASYITIALINAKSFEEIEKKNKSILDSIRYARVIQQAILPKDSLREAGFDYFVIYKPKDIVSGDFYWYGKVAQEDKPDASIIAVADCTGHGVPGAFMSMIGNALLNEIVHEKHVHQPGEILELLNEKIISSLNQENTTVDDGMDLGLFLLEEIGGGRYRVTYSGVKTTLFYYEPSLGGSLQALKGDSRYIGGISARRKTGVFTSQTFELSAGAIIYLGTDGYADQNNVHRKRFGTKRLVELVEANLDKPIPEQETILHDALAEHQGNEPQRDDITLLGLKL